MAVGPSDLVSNRFRAALGSRTMIATADQAAPFLNKLCLRTGLKHFEIHASALKIAGSAHKDGLQPLKASAARTFDALFRPGRTIFEQPGEPAGGPFRLVLSADRKARPRAVLCVPLQYGTSGRAGAYFLGRTVPQPGHRQVRAIELALTALMEQLHRAGAVNEDVERFDHRETLCQEAFARGMSVRQAMRFCAMGKRELAACVSSVRRRRCAVSFTRTIDPAGSNAGA